MGWLQTVVEPFQVAVGIDRAVEETVPVVAAVDTFQAVGSFLAAD